MSFKLSQTTKDFFDVIRAASSYISIATVGIGLILYAVDKEIVTDFFKNRKVFAYCLGSAVILLPIVLPLLQQWLSQLTLKNRKLSNTIIKRQDVIIDITNGGKNASYYERLSFYRLGKKSNHYITKLTVSGKIDCESIHTLNCFYHLNNEKNRITIAYVNRVKTLNNYSSLINTGEKFLSYSAMIKESFTEEEESWDLYPTNYCIDYNLSIFMPEGKTLLYAKLYKKSGDNFYELEDISPLIVSENNRCKMLLQIVDYDYGDYLSLRWKLA